MSKPWPKVRLGGLLKPTARSEYVDPLKEDLNLELGKSGKEKNNPEFIFNTAFRISFFILFVPEFQIEGPSLRG